MQWWAWLLIGRSLLACLLAARLGRAIAMSEANDWVRRGRPERRSVERCTSAPATTPVPPPRAGERRSPIVMEQSGP
jgi:hypothetical protein